MARIVTLRECQGSARRKCFDAGREDLLFFLTEATELALPPHLHAPRSRSSPKEGS